MRYHIQEWADNSASLIAEDGYSLDVFDSVDEAIDACINDCMVYPDYIEKHDCYLAAHPLDFESCFI